MEFQAETIRDITQCTTTRKCALQLQLACCDSMRDVTAHVIMGLITRLTPPPAARSERTQQQQPKMFLVRVYAVQYTYAVYAHFSKNTDRVTQADRQHDNERKQPVSESNRPPARKILAQALGFSRAEVAAEAITDHRSQRMRVVAGRYTQGRYMIVYVDRNRRLVCVYGASHRMPLFQRQLGH